VPLPAVPTVQSPRRTSDPEAVRLIDEELEDLQCREAEVDRLIAEELRDL
jgi:hypothetical protein